MNENRTNLHVDWQKILQSFFDFEIGDNFQVFVKNRALVLKLTEFYDKISDQLFANLFNVAFIVKFRQLISLYSVNEYEILQWGTHRAQQRFEQCIALVRENLPVAFTSLLVKKYTNLEMIQSAYKVGIRTMANIVKHVANDESIPAEHREVMVDKLKTSKLIVGYPQEILDDKNVEAFFQNLELTGKENLVELVVGSIFFRNDNELRKFVMSKDGKLLRNGTTKWTDYTHENELETPFYFFESNDICKKHYET